MLLLCSFVLLSCNNTKVTDLKYKNDSEIYVFKDDKPFDGEAWSDDGKTFKFVVDNGVLRKVEFYSEDGSLFYITTKRHDYYYNEKGMAISESEARQLNESAYNSVQAHRSIFKSIISSYPYN